MSTSNPSGRKQQALITKLNEPFFASQAIDDLQKPDGPAEIVTQWTRRLCHGHWTPLTELAASISDESCKVCLQFISVPHNNEADPIAFARTQIAQKLVPILLKDPRYQEWKSGGKHKIRYRLWECSVKSRKSPERKRADLLARFRAPECTLCHNDIGELHVKGCLAELCPWCGEVAVQFTPWCRTKKKFGTIPDDERLRIDGYFRASREACEFGWLYYVGSDGEPIRCGPLYRPDVLPDVHRVMDKAFWDRQQKCYVKPDWMK